MSEGVIDGWEEGKESGKVDRGKVDRAFTEVYQELRRIAQSLLYEQPPGHTLQTTALVHEAFLKLKGSPVTEDRGHFLRLAADAMRQILVDHARGKNRLKRGGGRMRRQELVDVATLAADPDVDTILALEEAFCRLEGMEPRAAQVIKLRFFAGLSVEETAEVTGLSVSTVNREWKFARAWLFNALGRGRDGGTTEQTTGEQTTGQPGKSNDNATDH